MVCQFLLGKSSHSFYKSCMITHITKRLPALILLLITLLITISMSDAQETQERRVLIIGDSHSVGIFGMELDQLFRKSSNIKVATYASCGSVAGWFFSGKPTKCGYFYKDSAGITESGTSAATPLVESIIKEFKPDYLVVELGGNYWGYSSTFSRSDMAKLADLARDYSLPCLWAGAPDARKKTNDEQQRTYDDLEVSITHACTLFDSRKVTQYPATGGDGIHYWGNEASIQAKKWAAAVYEAAALSFNLNQ